MAVELEVEPEQGLVVVLAPEEVAEQVPALEAALVPEPVVAQAEVLARALEQEPAPVEELQSVAYSASSA